MSWGLVRIQGARPVCYQQFRQVIMMMKGETYEASWWALQLRIARNYNCCMMSLLWKARRMVAGKWEVRGFWSFIMQAGLWNMQFVGAMFACFTEQYGCSRIWERLDCTMCTPDWWEGPKRPKFNYELYFIEILLLEILLDLILLLGI